MNETGTFGGMDPMTVRSTVLQAVSSLLKQGLRRSIPRTMLADSEDSAHTEAFRRWAL